MNEVKVDIVPLSVNKAWQGRRFKTPAYKSYEESVLWMLPKMKVCQPPFKFYYTMGFSSTLSDLLNPEKITTDIICKKYCIDDKDIFEMHLYKRIVPKGKEFFSFKIENFQENA